MARMPRKTGRCEISGCRNTPTDWHHVISQNQIRKRGLPKSFFTDPGNLKEFCRKHHDMTTASMDRKRLENKDGKPKNWRKQNREKWWDEGRSYQCEGITRAGKRCQVSVSKKGRRCAAHRSNKQGWFRKKHIQCIGTNKNGSKCRHKKSGGYPNGYCPSHQDQIKSKRPSAKERRNMEEWELATLELDELIESLDL